ncbi:MAG TPA: type II toxin-antitoxin system VapC family toxin [Terracidiphilus sp.]|jgi:tRNA(fMet)-specific endonuclease VapC|nr:type II toxin-antitoxin system VapC family toxin [Terracidiphilus sp.]
MPPAYLLDRNIVSYFVRGNFPAVRKQVARKPLESLAVSAVTEGELRYWVASCPRSIRTRTGVEDFLVRVASLPWDSDAARTYAGARNQLKRKGRALNSADLMIAAHALSLDLTLVTHDSIFAFVDGLKTEDWTVG